VLKFTVPILAFLLLNSENRAKPEDYNI